MALVRRQARRRATATAAITRIPSTATMDTAPEVAGAPRLQATAVHWFPPTMGTSASMLVSRPVAWPSDSIDPGANTLRATAAPATKSQRHGGATQPGYALRDVGGAAAHRLRDAEATGG